MSGYKLVVTMEQQPRDPGQESSRRSGSSGKHPTILFRIAWIFALLLVVAEMGLRTFVRMILILGSETVYRLFIAPLFGPREKTIERVQAALRTGGVSVFRASGTTLAQSRAKADPMRALVRTGGVSGLKQPRRVAGGSAS
jgi:hypothetical protein